MPRSRAPSADRHSPDERAIAPAADETRRTRVRPQDEGLADVAPAMPLAAADLERVLDRAPDPLYVVDRSWRVRYLNTAAAQQWGLAREDAIGRTLWALAPTLVDATLHDRLVDAMRERQAVQLRVPARGDVADVCVTTHPTADGLLVLEHDVDPTDDPDSHDRLAAERAAREEAERLAAELQTARETADGIRRAAERARLDAESAARAKSDFLATMSHELRTPINAITGYTQLLELGIAGPVTDTQRSYLGRLYASGRHLLGLVDDVLDLANIERGRMSITREVLSTGPVVAAALALVAPEAAARSIRLVDERDDELGLPFLGDEHRVRQILLNLLANAVKFTAPGGTVSVSYERIAAPAPVRGGKGERRGACVAITVRDTGIGITPDQQGAIFEPFMQADSSRTRTAGGTGLGLALSRRLARLMDGDLDVESAVGQGSAFTLSLPAYPADADASAPPQATSPLAAGLALPDEGGSGRTLELGARMRTELDALLDRHIARMRGDAVFGAARHLSRTQLEDYALALLSAILTSLTIVEETGGMEGELLRDGTAIQEHVAFRHGEQRYRLGWTEAQVEREYQILADETLSTAHRFVPVTIVGAEPLLALLARLLDRAREISLRGLQHARRFAHDG